MKREAAMQTAHDLLMGEFEDLSHDPADYLGSMGLNPTNFSGVNWNDADWDEADTEMLADALMRAFRASTESEPIEALMDALYDDKVSDTRADIMARAINRMVPA